MEPKLLTAERFVDLQTGISYRYVYSETERFRPHYHDYCEIFLVLSGGIGNIIDRIRLGFVVDMFDFRLIDFPIFNVADIFLTVGAAMGIIYILFIDKDLFKDDKKVKNDDSENNG